MMIIKTAVNTNITVDIDHVTLTPAAVLHINITLK